LEVGVFSEFKTFINKGNAIDLAVGVIIGAAFGKIVNSLVTDMIMPVVGMLVGEVAFTNLFVPLDGGTYDTLAAAREAGAPVLAYGAFINVVVEFGIVAFSIFLVVRQMNKMRTKEEEAAK
jgi:large conductance mechanosensitive channel